jgi:hypothetical protein
MVLERQFGGDGGLHAFFIEAAARFDRGPVGQRTFARAGGRRAGSDGRLPAIIHVVMRRLVEVGGFGEIVPRQGFVGALARGIALGGSGRFAGRPSGAVVPLQDRIALQLLLAIFGQLDVRQLQQLDGLLQLRRHDQRLALTHFQSLTDCRHA